MWQRFTALCHTPTTTFSLWWPLSAQPQLVAKVTTGAVEVSTYYTLHITSIEYCDRNLRFVFMTVHSDTVGASNCTKYQCLHNVESKE